MSSTHVSLHVHVVFGTKNRQPLIEPKWQDRLHALLGGCAREVDAVPEAVGGMPDHVHLLLGLGASHRVADVVRDLKRASSAWVHQEVKLLAFAWQEGYGAFSVSASDREGVRKYVQRQREHHRVRTFREEYIGFLQRSGLAYDERYLD